MSEQILSFTEGQLREVGFQLYTIRETLKYLEGLGLYIRHILDLTEKIRIDLCIDEWREFEAA